MAEGSSASPEPGADFVQLAYLVAAAPEDAIEHQLASHPEWALATAAVGATRGNEEPFFLPELRRHIYAGDTLLHLAAAAFRRRTVELLLARGANARARNRRGAEPLHYAADANRWDPAAQAETIACLIAAGADPNTADRSGTRPLHRAVRTRSAAAVQALLAGGADSRLPNGNGSTPLHLALQTTGRGGSGDDRARQQQEEIVRLLLGHGALATDVDGRGRQARQVAPERLAALLEPG